MSETQERQAVAIEDETSWPVSLQQLLAVSLPILRAHHEEEERRDKIRQGPDLVARYRPMPPNPHRERRKEILLAARRILSGCEFVGYHCTRLTARGIESVQRDGLKPLDSGHLTERIESAVADGDLSEEIAQRLRSAHQADDDNRAGMIWFVFGRDILRQESGLYRFFTSWGGEALYNSHEDDPQTGPALRSMGTACIVEAAIPFAALDRPWGPVQGHFVDRFLCVSGVQEQPDGEFESYVSEPIGAERIRRIIRRADPEFGALTGVDLWREPLP